MTTPVGAGVRTVVLDIEGTTTPVDFVVDVLFPYARVHVGEFLVRRSDDPFIREDIRRLREDHAAGPPAERGPPAWPQEPAREVEAAADYVRYLMDHDRKSTGLKSLQGHIWEEGYQRGALAGQVYEDVPRALARWRAQGREIAIFSSGSVLAQKLLFSTTAFGDLTRQIDAFFDTTTGPKREAASYRRIASNLGKPPTEMLFLSDVVGELDASREAGMATSLCVRGGEAFGASDHPILTTFDTVYP